MSYLPRNRATFQPTALKIAHSFKSKFVKRQELKICLRMESLHVPCKTFQHATCQGLPTLGYQKGVDQWQTHEIEGNDCWLYIGQEGFSDWMRW